MGFLGELLGFGILGWLDWLGLGFLGLDGLCCCQENELATHPSGFPGGSWQIGMGISSNFINRIVLNHHNLQSLMLNLSLMLILQILNKLVIAHLLLPLVQAKLLNSRILLIQSLISLLYSLNPILFIFKASKPMYFFFVGVQPFGWLVMDCRLDCRLDGGLLGFFIVVFYDL